MTAPTAQTAQAAHNAQGPARQSGGSRWRPDVGMGAIRVWQRHRDVSLRLWKTDALGIGVEPWVVIIAMGLGLGQFVELDGGQDYIQFLGPGLLAIFPMFTATFECSWGSYVRLEMQRTFEAIIATPVSVDEVITGDILWGATRSLISGTYIFVVLLVLTPWLDIVQSPWAVLAIPAGILQALLFSAFALAFVSVARAMSHFAYFFNLTIMPMFWFGGAFFPLDDLPGWAQSLAWWVPLSHAVSLYRGLLAGDLEWTLLVDVAWLSIATVACYLVALRLMRRRLIM